MNKIGDLVYWEMREVTTTKDALKALGIESYIPRNDFKTSLIKALHRFTKGNEKLYRRFNDTHKSVSFSVFVETVDGEDLALSKTITIKLDKELGILQGADGTELLSFYDEEKKTIDSKQLRTIILKTMKRDCLGVSMREGGGIYYINQAHSLKSKTFIDVFTQIEGVRFHQVPIFDNKESRDAVQDATAADLISDIESLLNDIQREHETRHLTKRRLEGKVEEIGEIMEKATALKDGLRTKYSEVETKLKDIEKLVDTQINSINDGLDISENFLDRLLAL